MASPARMHLPRGRALRGALALAGGLVVHAAMRPGRSTRVGQST